MAPIPSGIAFFVGFVVAWAVGFAGIVGEVYACIAVAGAIFTALGIAFLTNVAATRTGFYAIQRRWPSRRRLPDTRWAWIAFGGGLTVIGAVWLAGGVANL
jgi:hypothetical protein